MIILKSKTEFNKMKISGQILGNVLYELYNKIKPGVTTLELNELAEKIIFQNKAIPKFKNYKGFPFAICASKNKVAVHGFPNEIPLIETDIISIDAGILKNGYCSDAAFTKAVGHPATTIKKFIETTKTCLMNGIEQFQENNKVGNISNIINKTAVTNGYNVLIDYGGHGIGRELHEDPKVPNLGNPKWGTKFKIGTAIAIEPILSMGKGETKIGNNNWSVLTQDEALTAHFEHTVFLTDNGPEILTNF